MTGKTHLVGGIASLALPAGLLLTAGVTMSPESAGLATLGALLGSLFPDLDASESALKGFTVALNPTARQPKGRLSVSPFRLPALLLHGTLGHRALLHSLAGLAVSCFLFALPLGMFFGAAAAVGFLLGYTSHVLLDACTPSGVPLFYPRATRVHLVPPWLRITTGSPVEDIVFALLAAVSLFLLVLFLNSLPPLA